MYIRLSRFNAIKLVAFAVITLILMINRLRRVSLDESGHVYIRAKKNCTPRPSDKQNRISEVIDKE